ncbi:hypothetical protein BDBG_00223 [Blastomyces gilchristii SLH14081]|uniref:PSI domain-containing protein n=1 Tax=Blastomyces gilchristii (strain SLH14081) TaxID=559298 RepID=A0A179U682_BLAGS|nr:uncharacterized protein BDBG_00223 [Blastomyces gilchristii SLH14081]OAT03514.1 hypothetical protein BDBG_00223 [Blastomyces gilchristii SLH14081]
MVEVTEATAPAAALELHLPSEKNSTLEISPEFLRRHRPKHRDGRGGDGKDEDPLFYICWQQQSCGSCLKASVECSWCPGSSTCVPNRSLFPLLAPLTSSAICPLAARERWELRAAPLGCNVSTFTLLTGVVSVLGTLALVLVGWCGVVLGRKGWRAAEVWRRDRGRTWGYDYGYGVRRGRGRDHGYGYGYGYGYGNGNGNGRGRDHGRERDRGTRRWVERGGERRLVFVVEEERRPLLV